MALGLVNTAAENTQQIFSNVLTFTSSALTLTAGDTMLAMITWGNNAATTGNTGDVTAFSDTLANTWTRIGTVFYTSGTTEGVLGFAFYWSHITTGGSSTFSGTVSAGTWDVAGTRTIKFATVGYSNAFTPFFDAASSSATGTSTTLTTNGVTPTLAYDGLVMFGCQGSGANQTITTPTGWTQRFGGSSGPFLFELPYVGKGYSVGATSGFYVGFNSAPFAFQGTISGTVDWGAILIAVPSTQTQGLAQGDTTEASFGDFQQFKQLYFVGDLFLGGYLGLTFMKNVFVLSRDFWDTALSTPYSGQLFPTGGNSGGPGQVYPF
jgi:hypothetical protein